MTSIAVAKWYIEICLCLAGGVWYWLNWAVKIQHFPNNFIFRRFLLLFFSNKGFHFLLGVHFWNMTPHSETTTNIDHTARQPSINSSPQSREAVLSRAGAPHTKYLFALQRSNFSGQWVSHCEMIISRKLRIYQVGMTDTNVLWGNRINRSIGRSN